MLCPCGYKFALDPKKPPRFGDNFFQATIRRASANQTQYFTLNQLYTAACSLVVDKAAKRRRGCLFFFPVGVLAIVIGFFLVPETARTVLYIWLGILVFGMSMVYFGGRSLPRRRDWDTAVRRWQGANKEIPFLIQHPALLDRSAATTEPDLFAYGIERILICERDEIVDLLVLNRFHSEQGTLVVSENGYPSHLFPLAKRTISEVPATKVFLLHDASKTGCQMKLRLFEKGMLTGSNNHLFDLGVDRGHALQNPWFAKLAKANEGRFPVDLFLPKRLITTLGRAISELLTITAIESKIERQRQAASNDDGVIIFSFGDDESFVVDWGGDDSGGDGDGE